MNWIKQFIDYKQITVFKFEKEIGVRSTIDKAIKANSNLRADILAKIIEKYPEINAKWLLTGNGEMLEVNNHKRYISQENLDLSINESRLKFEIESLKRQVVGLIKDKEFLQSLLQRDNEDRSQTA